MLAFLICSIASLLGNHSTWLTTLPRECQAYPSMASPHSPMECFSPVSIGPLLQFLKMLEVFAPTTRWFHTSLYPWVTLGLLKTKGKDLILLPLHPHHQWVKTMDFQTLGFIRLTTTANYQSLRMSLQSSSKQKECSSAWGGFLQRWTRRWGRNKDERGVWHKVPWNNLSVKQCYL